MFFERITAGVPRLAGLQGSIRSCWTCSHSPSTIVHCCSRSCKRCPVGDVRMCRTRCENLFLRTQLGVAIGAKSPSRSTCARGAGDSQRVRARAELSKAPAKLAVATECAHRTTRASARQRLLVKAWSFRSIPRGSNMSQAANARMASRPRARSAADLQSLPARSSRCATSDGCSW